MLLSPYNFKTLYLLFKTITVVSFVSCWIDFRLIPLYCHNRAFNKIYAFGKPRYWHSYTICVEQSYAKSKKDKRPWNYTQNCIALQYVPLFYYDSNMGRQNDKIAFNVLQNIIIAKRK